MISFSSASTCKWTRELCNSSSPTSPLSESKWPFDGSRRCTGKSSRGKRKIFTLFKIFRKPISNLSNCWISNRKLAFWPILRFLLSLKKNEFWRTGNVAFLTFQPPRQYCCPAELCFRDRALPLTCIHSIPNHISAAHSTTHRFPGSEEFASWDFLIVSRFFLHNFWEVDFWFQA